MLIAEVFQEADVTGHLVGLQGLQAAWREGRTRREGEHPLSPISRPWGETGPGLEIWALFSSSVT